MNMNEIQFLEQQYLQSLERCLRYIRSAERLSIEASIEELCKVLILQLCFEKKNAQTIRGKVSDFMLTDEKIESFYHRYFIKYVPGYAFKGWDFLKMGKGTFSKVVEELTHEPLYESNAKAKATGFTEFLQMHYSGYLSEYSTPKILSEYIMDVINPGKTICLTDPCCGLGGMLVEAIIRNGSGIKVKGFDVNQRMVNTTNLHLMMYGYSEARAECLDMLEIAMAYKDEPSDVIVSHFPYRHRTFSIAGKRDGSTERMFSRIQEDVIIGQILKMLQPDGIAAVVVSDELLMSENREESRRWLYRNAQILNITRFDGVAYKGNSSVRSYNVMFLRHSEYATSDVCMGTHIKAGESESEIQRTAQNVRKALLDGETDSKLNDNSKFFRLLAEEIWNVNLLFAREKMGSKYPTCLLKDILVHDRQRVTIKDARNYKQLMVRSKGLGVVERENEYVGSSSSKAVRYVAKSGQVIISSLEAGKGAVGIVPKHLDNALVSGNYYLFSIIRDDVDPEYLAMVLSSEPVLRQLNYHKRGNIMPRISIEKLKSLVIPKPSLDEQKKLVGSLVRKVKRVQQLQDELEKEQTEFSWKLFGNDEA